MLLGAQSAIDSAQAQRADASAAADARGAVAHELYSARFDMPRRAARAGVCAQRVINVTNRHHPRVRAHRCHHFAQPGFH